MDSKRERTMDTFEDGTTEYWRICLECEQFRRLEDWSEWSTEQKEKRLDYCHINEITRDKNFMNKNMKWIQRSKNMARAKKELTVAKLLNGLTNKQQKEAIRTRANELAESFLSALTDGGLWEVFEAAGDRMLHVTAPISEAYETVYLQYLEDPHNSNLKERLEYFQRKLFEAGSYKTMAHTGTAQPQYLKALDFQDSLGPSMRLYNVCRAKTGWDCKRGIACSCGYAYPSKLWWRPDPNR